MIPACLQRFSKMIPACLQRFSDVFPACLQRFIKIKHRVFVMAQPQTPRFAAVTLARNENMRENTHHARPMSVSRVKTRILGGGGLTVRENTRISLHFSHARPMSVSHVKTRIVFGGGLTV